MLKPRCGVKTKLITFIKPKYYVQKFMWNITFMMTT